MLTDTDFEEKQGTVETGLTCRALLGLRYILFTSKHAQREASWNNLRIVVQLKTPSVRGLYS